MITAAAIVPHPPLLYRELAGSVDAAAALRAATSDVVRRLLSGSVDRVVVVGRDDVAAGVADPERPLLRSTEAPVDVRRFGTVAPREPLDAPALPLSLGVGRRLLDEAGWSGATDLVAVPADTTGPGALALATEIAAHPGRTALLVLGEGSARRGQTAPGFLDDRAFGYDDALAAAVESGDAATLLALDPDLADDLMVLGRPAFTVLGACVLADGGTVRADLTYRDDPFGVTYLVALWSLA